MRPASVSWMKALSAVIAVLAYLIAAATPCPATPVVHAGAAQDSRSITAPCDCGCAPHGGTVAGSQRVDPGLRIALPALLDRERGFDFEIATGPQDAPISVEAPVPIAA